MKFAFDNVDLTQRPDWFVEKYALGLPPVRGADADVMWRPGKVWQEKVFDARHIILGLVITGTTLGDLEDNFDILKALFGQRTQALLEVTLEDTTVLQQYAEVIGDLGIVYLGPTAARMVVDFLLAEPYLRDGSLDTDE